MPPFELCTQPECHLREEHVDRRSLTELIVRVLAGEEVRVKSPIEPTSRCVDCVRRILRGGKPLPTVADAERIVEAGRWSNRRLRRDKRRGSHGL